MLALLSAYRLWRRTRALKTTLWCQSFSQWKFTLIPKKLSNFRKHTDTHLLSLSDAVRNGFLPFLDSRFRKKFLKFMIIYGWLFNFSQISEALESLKLSKNPEASSWTAGTGGQRHQRGRRERMKGGGWAWGESIPISFSVSSALV